IQLPDDDLTVRVDAARKGASSDRVGDTVVYPSSESDVDTVLKPIPAGLDVGWLLRSAKSPEELRFSVVSASDGHKVELKDADGGGIAVLHDGDVTALIAPPVALDNDGYPVPVQMRVEADNTVLVTVRHK